MAKGDGALLVKVSEILKKAGIWMRCFEKGFRGRCWGQQGPKSRSAFIGSNIIICDGEVIVLIHQYGGNGEIRITSFVPVMIRTPLEEEIRTILKRELFSDQDKGEKE